MSPDFSSKTVETLSKRVAHHCSNPDCGKLTVGPNTEPSKATNIGEAAHIYGAKMGSARYRAVMSNAERSLITNAIWLCRDCHGLIDRDELRFPAELLLRWKAHREAKVLRDLGKSGEILRLQVLRQEIDQLGDIPLFVKAIIDDKPRFWEFVVAAELLEFYMKNTLRQADQLKKGLYARPRKVISYPDFILWSEIKMEELMGEIHCLEALIPELMTAWGTLGTHGNPIEIKHVCLLYGQCAQRIVDIAEETNFVFLPEQFKGIGRHFSKGALHIIDRLPELYKYIRSVIESEEVKGPYKYTMKIDWPEGWPEEFDRLLKDGMNKFLRDNQ